MREPSAPATSLLVSQEELLEALRRRTPPWVSAPA
jgi:hypothetical protein